MKKLFVALLAAGISVAAFAQPQGGHRGHGKPDFEKIKAEKVAFITSEVGLDAKEAESFWPVYNKIEEEQHALVRAERQAYKALSDAIAAGSGIEAALDSYLKAKEANVNLHVKNAKDYKKILSADKVAKFYTCEEKFLRRQLGKLGGGRGPKDGKAAHADRRRGQVRGHRDGSKVLNGAPAAGKAGE